MDFIDQIQAIAAKAHKQGKYLLNEEATKGALVRPFIQALGYDLFNPEEVAYEYTADVGTKKGEKVDIAILKDGKPIILFECKNYGADLNKEHADQLYRYFSVTEARIAVLTNGVKYRFYTDLEEPNKMDQKPFMEFDLLNIQEPLVAELKKFTKSAFNLDKVLTVAGELKYTKEIKRILGEQLISPSQDFVKFFVPQVYSGWRTKQVYEQFTDITRSAFVQFINERITERLKSAMTPTKEEPEEVLGKEQDELTPRIITTEEELEGFYIVKSILREVVDPSRIYQRDTVSYFGILLDDNRKKPICRLHFNRPQKYIGIFDINKREEKIPIESVDDIYKLSEKLKETISYYERKSD